MLLGRFRLASGQQPLNALQVCPGYFDRPAKLDRDGLPLLAAEVVPAAVHSHDLASAGYAKARGGALVGLQFRHVSLLLLVDRFVCVRIVDVVILDRFLANHRRCGSRGENFSVFLFFFNRHTRSSSSESCGACGGGDLLLVRSEDDCHVPAFEHRIAFENSDRFETGDDAVQEVLANLRMRNLASAEHDRHFDLVALLEQLRCGARLEVDIVIVDLRLHPHLAELDVDLVFLGLPILLRLFVLEAAEVHQSRDRRACRRRDLDKVDITLPGHGDRFRGPHNPDLLAFFVDQTDFGNTNPLVDTRFRWRRLRR